MNYATWTALFILCAFTLPAEARLGETPQKCNTRYGKPVSSDTEDLEKTNFAKFEKNGIEIITTYSEGKCVQILFRKLSGEHLDADELSVLLKANSEDSGWDAPVFNSQFVRKDGKVYGMYNSQSKTLTLTNIKWQEDEKDLRIKAKTRRLKDF